MCMKESNTTQHTQTAHLFRPFTLCLLCLFAVAFPSLLLFKSQRKANHQVSLYSLQQAQWTTTLSFYNAHLTDKLITRPSIGAQSW